MMMNVKEILNVENTIASKWILVQVSQAELIVAMIPAVSFIYITYVKTLASAAEAKVL